ncbi:MAG: hypothetical protein ACRD2C_14025 [Acidimicrobiales bacterium]
MNENTDRIEQFKAEVAEMRLRDPATSLDRLFLRLGFVAMIAGIGLGIVAYFMSHGTTNQLQQRDAIVLALIGVAVVVAGAALFVKAALAGFLRFWLARLCYEQQAQADRIVATVRSADASLPEPGRVERV